MPKKVNIGRWTDTEDTANPYVKPRGLKNRIKNAGVDQNTWHNPLT